MSVCSVCRQGGGDVVPDSWANGGRGGVGVAAPATILAATGTRAGMVSTVQSVHGVGFGGCLSVGV